MSNLSDLSVNANQIDKRDVGIAKMDISGTIKTQRQREAVGLQVLVPTCTN